jgi:tetratricopeptide (TPR) repeat protein
MRTISLFFILLVSNLSASEELAGVDQKEIITMNEWIHTQIVLLKGDTSRLEEKMDTLRINQEKSNIILDLENFSSQINRLNIEHQEQISSQNSRISDITFYTNMWGFIFSLLGILITILAIYLGFSAKSKAIQAAREVTASWLNEIEDEIVRELKDKIADESQNSFKDLQNSITKAEHLINQIQDLVNDSKEKKKIIDEVAEKLKSFESRFVPENTLSSDTLQIESSHQDLASKETQHQNLFAEFLNAFNTKNYELSIKLIDEIIYLNGTPPEVVAMAQVNKGVILAEQLKLPEAIDCYNEVIDRFKNESDEKFYQPITKALRNKGVALGQQDRFSEAIEEFDILLDRFSEINHPDTLEQTAKALLGKGTMLGKLGKREQEIFAYDTLLNRFNPEKFPALSEQIANTLYNKAYALGTLNRTAEELATYELLINTFIDSSKTNVKNQILYALQNRGARLGKLHKFDECIENYNRLLEYIDNEKEISSKETIEMALNNKAQALSHANQPAKALETYEKLLAITNFDPHKTFIIYAFFNRGVLLEKLNRYEESISAHQELVQKINGLPDTEMKIVCADTMLFQASTYAKINKAHYAIAVCKELISNYGNDEDMIKHVATANEKMARYQESI